MALFVLQQYRWCKVVGEMGEGKGGLPLQHLLYLSSLFPTQYFSFAIPQG